MMSSEVSRERKWLLRKDGKVKVTVMAEKRMAVVFRLGRQIEMSQLAPEMQNGESNIT